MNHIMDMSINKEQIDSYLRASHAKRFVVENSITKVTSDGEPHEMMTMIAGLSGLFAAMIILGVLIALISCKGGRRNKHCKNCSLTHNSELRTCSFDRHSTHSTISTTKASSVEDGLSAPTTPSTKAKPTVAIISSGNLSGNLNSAFISSELNLTDSLSKPKKKTHFIDEVNTKKVHIKETAVDIERL
ncbi:uncharacterized protein [Eurosta solidaginis]|uniref:uncharacterized protein n=1 Tax=Eurosta solidaginis TaxID=178769 RepID=UPI00353098EA